MYANTILASVILVLATPFVHAEPIPMQRRDLGSVIDSLTSEAGSYYTKGTSLAASGYSVGMSYASVGAQEGLSDASTWLHGTTNPVIATVTTVGGVAETMVSSAGGPAVTLAPSGSGGVLTSLGGSEFTVIAAPTGTANAATNVHSMTLKASPVLAALVTVVGGTLLGAWLTC